MKETDADAVQSASQNTANTPRGAHDQPDADMALQQRLGNRSDDRILMQSSHTALQIGGQHITTADQMISMLDALQPAAAYSLANECMEALTKGNQHIERGIPRLHWFVRRKMLWQGKESEAAFRVRWETAIVIHERREEDIEYIGKILHKASGMSYPHVVNAINNEVISRLNRTGRGDRRQRHPIPSDLFYASRNRRQNAPAHDELDKLGLQLDQDGLCIELDFAVDPTEA
ncbi:hypothetical protein N7456_003936 [Penicillium angulare]|uniref:Uncharacterized protein n=1 Tax=Penicillium angulare TaxID=116970 RepID=A0A9W9FVK1_9EURO|nr:hypothetical protein N7456_003936 [Penicillium angulare]